MMFNCSVCLEELNINEVFSLRDNPYCREHFIQAQNIDKENYETYEKSVMNFKPTGVDYLPGDDPVNRPSHYTVGKNEVIDIIEDSMSAEAFIGYLEGNIKKYMFRWKYKNGLEDLKKARKYMDFLITKVEKDPS